MSLLAHHRSLLRLLAPHTSWQALQRRSSLLELQQHSSLLALQRRRLEMALPRRSSLLALPLPVAAHKPWFRLARHTSLRVQLVLRKS